MFIEFPGASVRTSNTQEWQQSPGEALGQRAEEELDADSWRSLRSTPDSVQLAQKVKVMARLKRTIPFGIDSPGSPPALQAQYVSTLRFLNALTC